jgi:hypothetical protein
MFYNINEVETNMKDKYIDEIFIFQKKGKLQFSELNDCRNVIYNSVKEILKKNEYRIASFTPIRDKNTRELYFGLKIVDGNNITHMKLLAECFDIWCRITSIFKKPIIFDEENKWKSRKNPNTNCFEGCTFNNTYLILHAWHNEEE